MGLLEAVKFKIFRLCDERNISINKLATICGMPPSSIKEYFVWKMQEP